MQSREGIPLGSDRNFQPRRLLGPAMDGRRTIAATQHATHRDHHNIHQQMFTISHMSRVGERLEVRTDRFNVHPFGCHATHPGMRQAGSPSDPRSHLRASTAMSQDVPHRGRSASLCRLPILAHAGRGVSCFFRIRVDIHDIPSKESGSFPSVLVTKSDNVVWPPVLPKVERALRKESTPLSKSFPNARRP